MRDKKRIPIILSYIQEFWEKFPDQRLGQLLENYVFPICNYTVETTSRGKSTGTTALTYWQEDDVTLQKITKVLKELPHPQEKE